MKTLRDLANHIREHVEQAWVGKETHPNLMLMWASEIEQSLDFINSKALAITHVIEDIIECHNPQEAMLRARIASIDKIAFDIIDETTPGYSTTKHADEETE